MKLLIRFYLITLAPIAVIIAGLVFFNLTIFAARLDDVVEQVVAANIRELRLVADNPVFLSFFDNREYGLEPETELGRTEILRLFNRVMHTGAKLDPAMVHIALLDDRGRVILARQANPMRQPFSSAVPATVSVGPGGIHSEVRGERHLTLAALGESSGAGVPDKRIRGYLLIEHTLPIAAIRDTERAFLARQLNFLAICSLLLAGLLFRAGKAVTDPIRNLAGQAREIAAGGFSRTFAAGDNIHELRDLGSTLNAMLAVIAEKQQQLLREIEERRKVEKELQKHQQHLEELVGRRTEELRHSNEELKEKNRELEAALAEIKTLRAILPLCSYCKKIRNDQGGWEQVDVYIHKHFDTDISHGICPECLKRHFPELSGSVQGPES